MRSLSTTPTNRRSWPPYFLRSLYIVHTRDSVCVLIERPHNIVPPHIRRKVALHARLPVRYLERRRVAPRLQRQLLLDHPPKVLRPALPRKLGRRRLDQLRVDEVRPADKGKVSCQRMSALRQVALGTRGNEGTHMPTLSTTIRARQPINRWSCSKREGTHRGWSPAAKSVPPW